MDDFVESKLEMLGFEDQIISQRIPKYDYGFRKPKDPIALSQSELVRELALLMSYSTHILTDVFLPQRTNSIFSVKLESKESDRNLIERIFQTFKKEEFYFVNVCLKNSIIHSLIEEKFPTADLLASDYSAGIFSSQFEMLKPQRFLCSPRWRRWLIDLSAQKPIILITPPSLNIEGEMIPDSFLSDLWSTSKYVSL